MLIISKKALKVATVALLSGGVVLSNGAFGILNHQESLVRAAYVTPDDIRESLSENLKDARRQLACLIDLRSKSTPQDFNAAVAVQTNGAFVGSPQQSDMSLRLFTGAAIGSAVTACLLFEYIQVNSLALGLLAPSQDDKNVCQEIAQDLGKSVVEEIIKQNLVLFQAGPGRMCYNVTTTGLGDVKSVIKIAVGIEGSLSSAASDEQKLLWLNGLLRENSSLADQFIVRVNNGSLKFKNNAYKITDTKFLPKNKAKKSDTSTQANLDTSTQANNDKLKKLSDIKNAKKKGVKDGEKGTLKGEKGISKGVPKTSFESSSLIAMSAVSGVALASSLIATIKNKRKKTN